MTEAVFQYQDINRVLNRQEQKAEFEAKNPKVEPSMYAWPYGAGGTTAVPLNPSPAVQRFWDKLLQNVSLKI